MSETPEQLINRLVSSHELRAANMQKALESLSVLNRQAVLDAMADTTVEPTPTATRSNLTYIPTELTRTYLNKQQAMNRHPSGKKPPQS